MKIKSPAWAKEVFTTKQINGNPVRFRVAYGGRSAAKSWEFARRLLRIAQSRKVRILCTREFQNSIKDSVHQVLSDQVEMLGLHGNFDPGVNYLNSHIGSEFIYKGLRHNSQEIKSTEGIDICWVEEAQSTSAESWKYLIPTIRKPGSEIWISFNPNLESDPTYQQFIANPRDNAIVKKVTYRENPWLSEESRTEMEYLKRVDYEAYLHVWEGNPRVNTEAQVLKGKYKTERFNPGKDWAGPYYGADWGFSQDPTALVKCWINNRNLYIESEVYGIGVDIDKTPALFDRIEGAKAHLIYADSARPETINYMRRHGYPRIQSVKKWPGSVEDGVAHLRSYEQIIIHPDCKHSLEEAHLWSYKKDRLTDEVLPQLVDKHNHIWDSVRYALSPLIQKRDGEFKAVVGLY